jgi:hypothetical protein
MTLRLTGIPGGTVDTQKREIDFRLQLNDGTELSCIADFSAAEQMASALGRMTQQFRQSKSQNVTAEQITEYAVQRDPLGGPVLLRLITPQGIPYTFAVPLSAATDIATRLQIESAKVLPSGNA